ncbi:MAG: YlbF family regulator [Clostridia bacterium]|nr:YlbF family regulator [Clostridia bacterium]
MMTEEIKNKAIELGKLIANSEEVCAANAAKAAYGADATVQNAIAEYNAQNQALANAYGEDPKDEALIASVKTRIGELYNTIVNAESYLAYVRAEAKITDLMKEVNDVINFEVTGVLPSDECTGNCASCHGCH